MTRQKSNITNNAMRLAFCFVFYSLFPSAVNAMICGPGYYAFTENGSDCQVCPPGTYSELPGAEFCILCLDTIYGGEGANSAELWNGDLYCIHLGSINDDFLASNSGDATEPSVSISPSSIQIVVEAPSVVPSLEPSFGPASRPSISPSTMPSTSITSITPTTFSSFQNDGGVTTDEFQSLVLCNDQEIETDCFELYGQLKNCPEQHEMIWYPILAILFLIILITFLEFIIPNCFVNHIWWGIEYLQMLYFIEISSVSLSPAATFFFGKMLPIFAIDFNVSFSLQCIMPQNWPQKEAADQLLFLSLPIIFLIISTFISKASSNWIIREKSISRWMAALLYVGYLKLTLSSLEAIRLPTSWSADILSMWANSDSFYSTLAGVAGLLFYGLVFPIWFLQGILRHKMLTQALAEADEGQDKEDDERQLRNPTRKKHTMRKNQIFMTLGIFPINLRQTAWWWPGILMLRKFLLAIFWFCLPGMQSLFLVIFLLVNLLSVIIQQYFEPLGNESSIGRKKIWHSIATVDTVLNVCLTAVVGIAFFFSWPVDTDVNMRSLFQKRTEDSLILSVVSASTLFLAVTIGVCCTRPEPCFRNLVSQIIIDKNNNDTKAVRTETNFVSGESSDEIPIAPTITESFSSHNSEQEIEFFAAGKDSAWSRQGTNATPTDEEFSAESEPQTMDYASYDSSPYLIPQENEKVGRADYESKSTSSRSWPDIDRCDSTIATNEDYCDAGDMEDDAKTLYEEVWVDEETGEEIIDPEQGNWMDAETGLPAVHSNDLDKQNTENSIESK